MKKLIYFLLLSFPFLGVWKTASAQIGVAVVVHQDANLLNITANTAAQAAAWAGYKDIADKIKANSDSIAAYEAIILSTTTAVQTALTSVSDLEKQAHAVVNAFSQLQGIVKNVATASVLAAQKPYLAAFYNQYEPYIMGRITDFQGYINTLLTGGDDGNMMDKEQRDELIWGVCNKINSLYNYTQAVITQMQSATFADAVKSAVPTFSNNNAKIVSGVIANLKL